MPRKIPSFLSAPTPEDSEKNYLLKKPKTVHYRIRKIAKPKDDEDGKDFPVEVDDGGDFKKPSKKSKPIPPKTVSSGRKDEVEGGKPASKEVVTQVSEEEIKEVEREKDENMKKADDEGEDEATKLFKKLDADGSGNITLDEFKKGLKDFRSTAGTSTGADGREDVEVPEEFNCPLTCDLMTDPVINENGNTYERSAIEEWYALHDTDPLTGENVKAKSLVLNRMLRDLIIKFCKKHKIDLDGEGLEVKSSKKEKGSKKNSSKPSEKTGSTAAKAGSKRKRQKDVDDDDGEEEKLPALPISGKAKRKGKPKSKKGPKTAGDEASSSKPSKKKTKVTPKVDPVIWAWKSDLYLDDNNDAAWTEYDAATVAKIEKKYQEDPGQSFVLDATYSIDLADSWQYRTSETHRRRPIRRIGEIHVSSVSAASSSKKTKPTKMDVEDEDEESNEEEEEEEEEEGKWFWKSDLDLEDEDPEAWTMYPKRDSKKIEQKYQEGKDRFKY
mmetsp:Transcript_1721/g.3990  ORF Transcript_1721/g.3990 Transcript_1721/m.3990 type:complete len:498 (+) Transcript_1721:63-1556(+)